MRWAVSEAGERIEATPHSMARCPACLSPVRAKCGTVVAWHWAHLADDCDPWSEPESAWHRDWKDCFPVDLQEVVIGNHRADVRLPDGLVIEFQASGISSDEIRERERFYGRMVWVLRGADFADNMDFRDRGSHVSFRWKWPRKSWWAARSPVYIDFGKTMVRIGRIYHDTPCGGWCQPLRRHEFIDEAHRASKRLGPACSAGAGRASNDYATERTTT